MAVIFQDDFIGEIIDPIWTQDPQNGSIGQAGGVLTLETLSAQCLWRGVGEPSGPIANRPAIRIALADILATGPGLYYAETSLTHIPSGSAWSSVNQKAGICIWEDNANAYGIYATRGIFDGTGTDPFQVVANTFARDDVPNVPVATVAFRVYWNTSGVPVTIFPGVGGLETILQDGQGARFDDPGFGWISTTGAVTIPIAITSIQLWGEYDLATNEQYAFDYFLINGPEPTPQTDIVTTVTVTDVVPITGDLIKVEFSGLVAVTDQVTDPNNYQLSPGITVAEVLPIEDPTTTEIYLRLFPKAMPGTDYTLTIPSAGTVTPLPTVDIPSETFYTPDKAPLQTMTATWVYRRTKVDSILGNLGRLYDTSVSSNIFQILTAMGISDEEIGGGGP